MKVGIVRFTAEYVVDLDDKEMVEHAKQCVSEDVYNAVKYNEVEDWIRSEKRPGLTTKDIPSFLTEK